MGLIDVKYVRAENLTAMQRKELQIEVTEGLIAIETRNPDLKRKGVVIKDYVEHLLNLGEKK